VAFSSAVAGSAQCIIGLGKVAAEAFAPERLDELNSQAWFEEMNLILDKITLAGAGASMYVTARFVLVTKAATGKPMKAVLKGLSNKERLRLTSELRKYRKYTPGMPKRYTRVEIREQAKIQRKDLVAALLAIGGSIQSGTLKSMAVGLYEE
jgi:hypothetical protein